MPKMTNAQLTAENARLREHCAFIETALASAQAELAAVRQAKVAAREERAREQEEPSLELIAHLQTRGMPRFFQFGREVLPSAKQVAYWQQRVGGTH